MKKRNFLFLLAAPLLLVSCGGGSEEVIPTGDPVSEAEVSTHFKKATENLAATDAIGMKLELSGKATSDMLSTTGGYDMKGTSTGTINATLKAGAKGLRAEKFKDVKASVTGELSMSSESKVEVGGSSVSASSTESSDSLNGKAGLYVDNGYIYGDFESIRPIMSIIASITGGEFDEDTPLKIKASLIEKEGDANPIPGLLETIKWDEMVDQLKETFSKEIETIKTKAGDYAYVFTGDNSVIFGGASTDSASLDVSGETKFSFSFNDLGLTAIGATVNGTFKTVVGGVSQTTTIEASAKASFFYGNNVTVEGVPNPNSFVLSE